jgi:serine/threonine protein kinase
LHHAGVPRVFECGVARRVPWIATELVKGTPLEALGITQGLATLRDTATILAAAHDRSIVHRNLTPDLIVRAKSGTYITSWADAAVGLDDAVLATATGRTRYYRAPELAATGPCDPRADVFALGAIVYEAITGSLPLLTPVRFPHIPNAVHALLARMLAPSPDDRPSAADVRAEAARLAELHADGEPVIEEVEVELVDIGSVAPSKLRWTPPFGVET